MKSNAEVQLTIVVIAHNEVLRIGACLEGLMAQDSDIRYEVVVVDDGSDDGTGDLIGRIMQKHPNVRFLRHETNRGRGAARLTGQLSANSRWIGFVDADIVVPVDWLSRCLLELEKADGVSGVAQPDGDCAVLWRICRPTLRLRPGSAEVTGNNVLFSSVALAKVPFSPDSKLGEDFRQAKAMVRLGLKLVTVLDLIVEHRETKSYRKAVKWMWQSGIDATALLFEFRIVRTPDLAWFAWLFGTASSIIVGVLAGWWWGGAILVGETAAVNLGFIYSRFMLFPHPSRWMKATIVSLPLLIAYLLGRCAGLVARRSQGGVHPH
jgi:glycosyltransferase involved in cell wall biosynthesis